MPKGGNVEERIVEMRLDNKNFESGAKTTISTLEKLERALKMKGTKSSLDDLQRSVDKFDANNMTKGLEKVQMSFSALEIMGMRVISNLTDSLYGFTMKMAKSLSVDQITAGWSKYEKMLESTQTIMAATAGDVGEGKRWADQAEQMADIQKYLDGLLWYTDETSYGFTDMTDNLGKFLAAGVDLDQAYKAMMGIASWGATAGAKPGEVARAMYNISQAMGTGSMKAIDWKSIENANMATLDFKKNAIATAAEMGKLDEVISEVANNEGFMISAEDMYNEAGYILNMTDDEVNKVLITAENFRDSLQQNWFDKDVMTRVFEKYGQFAELLRQTTSTNYGQQVYDAEGNALEGLTGSLLEATDMLELLDMYRDEIANPKHEVKWEDYIDGAGLQGTVDEQVAQLKGLLQALDDVGIAYSETGFRMGQEAKTFTDAIEATKDAVSSQWMKSFQYIFGDYMQAKEFWTDVTTELWDIFAAGGARRNQILKEWSRTVDELGHTGRDYLLGKWEEQVNGKTIEIKGALWNLLDAIHTVTDPIRDAFTTAFGFDDSSIESTAKFLRELTKRFKEFTEEIGFSESAQEGIKKAFTGIFTVLKTGLSIVGKAVQIFSKVAMVFGNILDGVISLGNGLADLINGNISFDDFAQQIQNFYKSVKESAKNALLSLLPSEKQLLDLYESVKTGYADVKAFLNDDLTWKNFNKLLPSFDGLFEKVRNIGNYLKETYPNLFASFEEWRKNHTFFSGVLDDIKGGFERLEKILQSINIDTDAIKEAFGQLGTIISTVFGVVFGDPKEMQEKVSQFFTSVWQGLKDSTAEWKPADYFGAIRTAGFTVLLAKIGSIISGFKKAENEFTSIFPAITNVLNKTAKTIDSIGQQYRANAYIKMALAVSILAASLWLLAKVPEDRLTDVAVSLAMLVGVLTLFAKSMGQVFGKGTNTQLSGNKITVFNSLASILIGFALVLGAIVAVLAIAKNADPLEMLVVATGMVGLLWVMAEMAKKMSEIKFQDSVSTIASILSFSLAIQMLIPVLVVLALMPIDKFLQSVFGIGALFVALGGLVLVMNKFATGGDNLKKVATSMLIMAVALNALLPVMFICSMMSAGGFGRAIAGLFVVMALLGGLTAVMSHMKVDGKNFLMLAGGMAAMALAMNLMVLPLTALTAALSGLVLAIPWKTIIADLGGFGLALLKLAAVAVLVFAFSVAVAIAGAGVMLFGTGMLLAAVGAGALSLVLIPLATSITAFIKAINDIQGINIGKLLLVAAAFAAIGLAIGGTLLLLNKMLSGKGIGKKFSTFTSTLLSKLGGAGDKVGKKIKESIPKILDILGYILIAAGLYMMGIIPQMTEILVNSFIVLIDSVANSVEAHRADFVKAIEKIVRTFIGIAGDLLKDAFSEDAWANMSGWEKALSVILILLAAIKAVVSGWKLITAFSGLAGAAGAGAGGGLLGSLAALAPIAGPILAVLGAYIAASQISNKQQKLFNTEAYEGLGEGPDADAAALNRLQEAYKKTKEEYDNYALNYGAEGLDMLQQEVDARYLALLKQQEMLANSLGITTDDLRAQIDAAGGDATQIQAVKDATKAYAEAAAEAKASTEAQTEQFRLATESSEQYNSSQNAMWSNMITQAQNGELSMEQFKASFSGALEGSGISLDSITSQIDPSELYNTFMSYAQGIGEGTAAGVEASSDGVNSAVGVMSDNALLAFLQANGINSPSATYAEAATGIPEGVALGVTQSTGLAQTAVTAMSTRVMTAASAYFASSGSAAGGSAVAGIVNGVYANLQAAYDAGVAAGNAFMAGYDDATDTNSPSREMMKRGAYAMQGLMLGLQSGEGDVYGASSGIGVEIVGILQSAMAQIAMMASESFEFNPVITPVVDMTNIDMAAGTIGSKFSGARVGLSGEISNSVGRRVEQAERVASNMEAVTQTVNNGDVFTINVYASEGMDENALADAVLARMQNRLVRRGAAFG